MPRRDLENEFPECDKDLSNTQKIESADDPVHCKAAEDKDLLTHRGENVRKLPINDQIRELQTVIRDRSSTRGDFIFFADRLIRLVIEEGLNQLPYSECVVTTPPGHLYVGVTFHSGTCGVSVMRSGEAMERGLREVCRSMAIGKIMVQSDEVTHEAKCLYAKFPYDIEKKRVLLMYPTMSTGNTVIKAVDTLKEHGVKEENIVVLNLFASPSGVRSVTSRFPKMIILTSEIHQTVPNFFGQKYFGTEKSAS